MVTRKKKIYSSRREQTNQFRHLEGNLWLEDDETYEDVANEYVIPTLDHMRYMITDQLIKNLKQVRFRVENEALDAIDNCIEFLEQADQELEYIVDNEI